MAASPAVPGLKPLQAVMTLAKTNSAQESPAERTGIHAMPSEATTRSIRRRITPEAGCALEILGHAIEYLADEYAHEVGRLPVTGALASCVDPRVQAMQILMAANRQVYYECPVAIPLYRRILRRLRG